ncbi:hypothetical protein OUZ56_033801 [Daphnia magna]|uniref:Uncharacterized protein n=1 Tax=Daphnia magna TaxID=35525 RepID=A0ABQ9ZY89_9CRUS|nr:hypothetical protein OUZ56_033801 [Daphnia magna]
MNPIKLRYRAQESLSGSPQHSSLKILEESSDSISLSFGGTGKAVLLVKPFRLDVYDEDQLVLSVNAKGLLYHHLHYSSMLPKLINFMIESINLKILEESSDSISLSFGGTGKAVLLVKPFRLDVYDEDQLVLSVNAKGLLYHHLHYSSMLPKLINFMIESINYYLIILVPCPQSKKDGVL